MLLEAFIFFRQCDSCGCLGFFFVGGREGVFLKTQKGLSKPQLRAICCVSQPYLLSRFSNTAQCASVTETKSMLIDLAV